MEKVILDVSNVTKTFGDRVAVNNVSFTIKEGEIFGFLGPNGAGKTTTMKMICGLSRITKGQIRICNYDILNIMLVYMATFQRKKLLSTLEL